MHTKYSNQQNWIMGEGYFGTSHTVSVDEYLSIFGLAAISEDQFL